ncbi:DUF202 domain-containing protein [Synechococcus sp. CS-602]|uniref:YidH family protein n=1 Tax=Synechococcaceae TaxID=1890426 RepID=UPI0008FF07D5|nr:MULTISPECIES: DUF202 domain-containing protein [Synechococcaceae]MCT4364974.1 DUF202 domain-containing protein [Candidatus Regnicoccus frigidus MAG-AL1]APD47845.1 hypothetical protein BM449_05700 [Synechococcus sp. SynAce01]MCT0202943.1 DUF202 domain-containing protein [Synechococcus sp. CS-603]MCT0205796.1 DUF202 domain-containing protein [Synechococcus sp. CS-602]MCT0245202.1 DUF202 domain-containing protein [Synechococcus sp. CS-601]
MGNLNNELAKERSRAAAERTMMAWIRTSLSLISFGFGLDKIVGAINASRFEGSSQAGLSVRLVAIGFVLIGIVSMSAATRQHLRTLRQLKRDDFVYIDQTSITIFTAIALTLIGIVALSLLIMGASGS